MVPGGLQEQIHGETHCVHLVQVRPSHENPPPRECFEVWVVEKQRCRSCTPGPGQPGYGVPRGKAPLAASKSQQTIAESRSQRLLKVSGEEEPAQEEQGGGAASERRSWSSSDRGFAMPLEQQPSVFGGAPSELTFSSAVTDVSLKSAITRPTLMTAPPDAARPGGAQGGSPRSPRSPGRAKDEFAPTKSWGKVKRAAMSKIFSGGGKNDSSPSERFAGPGSPRLLQQMDSDGLAVKKLTEDERNVARIKRRADAKMRLDALVQEEIEKKAQLMKDDFAELASPNAQAQVSDTVEGMDISRICREFKLSVDEVRKLKEQFDEFDVDMSGFINRAEFKAMLASIMSLESPDDVPLELFHTSWLGADADASGEVNFLEFARWYDANRFSEALCVGTREREIRRLARTHQMAVPVVDRIYDVFQSFDEDGSGLIEEEEFNGLLRRLLRVPNNVEFPQNRIQAFWRELDSDGSGEVDFEEFLLWYTKYFSEEKSAMDPLQAFYATYRPIGTKTALINRSIARRKQREKGDSSSGRQGGRRRSLNVPGSPSGE